VVSALRVVSDVLGLVNLASMIGYNILDKE